MTAWQQLAIGALASLLSAIVAVYLTNRHSRGLAERGGAFRRPKIGLSLLNQALSARNPPLAWCFRHPGKEEQVALYNFPFALTNAGDARCDDVVVLLTGPAECFGSPKGTSLSTTPGIFKGAAKRSQNDLGNLTQVAYRINKVGAKSAVSIIDLINLRPSVNLSHTVHATTKDNVNVNARVIFSLAYVFRWSIITPDDGSIHFETPVYCIAAPTSDTVAKEFVESILSKKIQSHLNSAGRWERIGYRFLGLGELRKVVIADFGTPEIVSMKGQTLYRLDGKAKDCAVSILNCFTPRFLKL